MRRLVFKWTVLALFFSQPVWGEYGFERFLNNPPLVDKDEAYPLEPRWILSCLNCVTKEEDIAGFADDLMNLKIAFVKQGYHIASLPELCLHVRDRLIKMGTPANEQSIQTLYKELKKRDK